MMTRFLLSLSLFIPLSSVALLAQNEDRRHWKYIDDYDKSGTPSELQPLGSVSWTDGCYIGDNKAVVYASGNLFLFDYEDNIGVWTPIVISEHYKLNAVGEREVTTDRIPTNLKGMSLAYVGNSKILLGPGRLGSESSVSFKKTWVFDLEDNTWTLMIDETLASTITIPLLYNYGICHLIEDKVLIFGGRTSKTNEEGRNQTYVYDLSNNSWENITSTMSSSSPSVRDAHSLASLGEGSAIMFGGSSNDIVYDETWVFKYEGETSNWTQITTSPSPGRRYYALLQKLSCDIAILYGGTIDYRSGEDHYNDMWRFNYDRENNTGSWTDISFSEYPDRQAHNSSDKDNYLYYPSGSTDPLANDNYRHIDGESVNNGGGGYGYDSGNSDGMGNSTYRDHWGRQHGKRRASVSAFLGNDRILLHGGGLYLYNGSNAYANAQSVGKTYVFDLGIPDVFIDTVIYNPNVDGADVTISVGKLNDDRGEAIEESTLDVIVRYSRTGNEAYVDIPVTIALSNDATVSEVVSLPNLPPNTEIEIIGIVDAGGFGINYSDSYMFVTPGGDKTIHLINSNADGVSGENDYTILNSDALASNADFSISQWIKLDEPMSRYLFKRASTVSPISLEITQSQISFSIVGDNNAYTSVSPTALNMSEKWHHVVATFDMSAQMQYIYLDGELLVETANEGLIQDSNTDVFVIDVEQSLNIDEFQVWKKALTLDQIMSIMYQPLTFGFPNEVMGAVDVTLIPGVFWDDLLIYYKGDYLDDLAPFSDENRGCLCEVSGVTGFSLVNSVQTAQTDTGFYVHSDIPYINWTKEALHSTLVDDFSNEDNWHSNMYPTASNIKSYQNLVVNVNSNACYPIFSLVGYDGVHTLVLREGTSLAIDENCPLFITDGILYDQGVKVLIEDGAKLLFGEGSSALLDNPISTL